MLTTLSGMSFLLLNFQEVKKVTGSSKPRASSSTHLDIIIPSCEPFHSTLYIPCYLITPCLVACCQQLSKME